MLNDYNDVNLMQIFIISFPNELLLKLSRSITLIKKDVTKYYSRKNATDSLSSCPFFLENTTVHKQLLAQSI